MLPSGLKHRGPILSKMGSYFDSDLIKKQIRSYFDMEMVLYDIWERWILCLNDKKQKIFNIVTKKK